MNKVLTSVTYLLSIYKSIFLDKNSKKFISFCQYRWPKFECNVRKSIVLVELYPVDQTVLAFSYLSNILAEKFQSKIISFSLSYRNKHLFYWRYRRMIEIYKSFNAKSHFNTEIAGQPSNIVMSIVEDVFSRIKSKNDVLDISINGDLIGNEIYEDYLIELRKPTINIYSVEFRECLIKCIKTYVFWNDYFNQHDVKAVVLSHGIYRYGIIKTIANRRGIPVYLPTVRALYCLKKPAEIGIPKYELYPELFKCLPQETKSKGVAWAKERLSLRLSGAIGVDMSYSTQSAFRRDLSSGNVLRPSGRIKVLIATHCFFDNPNAYGRNLFPDFYEWISYLGEMSEKTEYDWYLKTHPDVLPGNDEVLNDLLAKYKKITKLPSGTSHLQLAEEGVSFVLTVYGSVGHECPLLGQTVINAGLRNPHIGYDFNVHIKSIEEYEECLLNLDKIKHKVDKEKIYEFYFMHYKFSGNNNLFFERYNNLLMALSNEDQNSSKIYEYFLRERTEENDESLCYKLSKFIESGDYKFFDAEIDFS